MLISQSWTFNGFTNWIENKYPLISKSTIQSLKLKFSKSEVKFFFFFFCGYSWYIPKTTATANNSELVNTASTQVSCFSSHRNRLATRTSCPFISPIVTVLTILNRLNPKSLILSQIVWESDFVKARHFTGSYFTSFSDDDSVSSIISLTSLTWNRLSGSIL